MSEKCEWHVRGIGRRKEIRDRAVDQEACGEKEGRKLGKESDSGEHWLDPNVFLYCGLQTSG